MPDQTFPISNRRSDLIIRDGSLWVKGMGRLRPPSVPLDSKVLQARVVKTALLVSVEFVVELEDRPSAPVGGPVGIDKGIRSRAIMSFRETVPAVTIDR